VTVASTIEIGGEEVDLNKPCDVALALRKRKIAVSAGNSELIIRMGGEEVTFSKANISALNGLIAEFEDKCRRASSRAGKGRARRISFL